LAAFPDAVVTNRGEAPRGLRPFWSSGLHTGAILYLVDTMFGNRFWFPFFRAMQEAESLCFDAVCFHTYQRQVFADVPQCRNVFAEPSFVHDYKHLPDHYDVDLDSWAAALEGKLGCLLTDLIQADRHLGIGFQQAGLNNPMTQTRAAATYWRTVRHIRRLDTYIEEILDTSRPSIVITSVVADLYSKMICAKARERGIPIRMFNSLQVGRLYGWYHDEFWSHPLLKRRLSETVAAEESCPLQREQELARDALPNSLEKEPVYATHYAASLKKALSPGGLLRSLLREARTAIGRRRSPRLDRPGFVAAARLQLRVRCQFAELRSRVTRQGSTLPERFVLYALHKEPEASTMVKAPEFNNQLAIIDLVARSLPSGFALVVKESMVSLGFRSDGFYEAVSAIPNVHLVMPDLRASELLEKASAAIVITGTVGLEAARIGLPVISFGTRNNYDVLDHVHVVTDFLAARKVLWQELREGKAGEQASRAARGRLYDKVAAELGVDVGEFFEARRGSDQPVSPKVIDGCIRLLQQSLIQTHPATERVGR
jgi:hypothetical protein